METPQHDLRREGASPEEEAVCSNTLMFTAMTKSPFRAVSSFQEYKTSITGYLSVANIAELAFCIAFFFLGSVIPTYLDSHYTWESPIPFQLAETGQVLLELDLSYEVRQESVTGLLRTILCVVMPLVTLTVVGFLFGPKRDVHAALCVYFVACGLTMFLTNTIKFYCGRFRPNFYDLCGFNKDTLECEGDEGDVKNSQRSFPSGHSSLAFSSMAVLSLYFLGKVGIQRGLAMVSCPALHNIPFPSLGKKLLSLLAVSPMILAFFIAASRVHEFYHHPADVVAGALIGSVCALFAHGLWYVGIAKLE